MANDIQYSIVFVGVNGSLLAQAEDVTIERDNNAQPVSTMALGYAGDSPGAAMMMITVQNAVPQAGFELDAGPFMASVSSCRIDTYGPAGLILSADANIYKDTFKKGVNSPASYSFQARAKMAQWTAGVTPP
jgi:hypothetical protein